MYNSSPDFRPTVATLPAAYRPQPPEIAEHRATILEALEQETIIAPSEWDSLKPIPAARQLGQSPKELLPGLQKSFSDTELMTTGVAYLSGDELKLSKVFGVPPESFRIRYHEQRPIDAVSARGVLSGARREWARLAGETRPYSDLKHKCIVTESDRDARSFQQLGLHVTAASPLRKRTLKTLSNCLTVRLPGELYKWTFAVPLWQLHEFKNSASTSAMEILQQVDRIARFHQLDCGSIVRFWYPDADELHRFRQAYKLSDCKLLAAEFTKSLANSCYSPAEALIQLRDHEQVDFGTALRRLEGVIAQSTDFPRVPEANAGLNTLTRSFHRDVLSKFPAASQTADGRESLVTYMATQLAKEWFERLDQVVAGRSIDVGNNPRRINRDQLFEKRWKVIDAFCRLFPHLPKPR